jgi:Ca2+-binding RTX toxin-like protein
MTGTARALVLATCTALLALFPATSRAAPEGDATIRVAPFTVQSGQSGDGQAFCPSGSRVVGGGVTQSSGAVESQVQVSGPLDETGLTSNLTDGDVGGSWYANVFNSSPGPSSYVSTAICSKASDATIRVAPFTVQQFQAGDGQAFCPSGSRVVGGGVTQSSGAGASAIQVSGPLDETGLTSNLADGDVGRSWYANVAHGFGDGTYVSTAICSPASDATIRVAPFTVQSGQTGDGQAFCPPGSRVVGGGLTQSSGAVGEYVQVSGPLDETGLTSNLTDGDVGRSVYANVSRFVAGTSTFVSAAICAPPVSTTAGGVKRCKGETATIYAPGAGTPGDDVIVGTSHRDKIKAGAGNDLVCAGGGNDKVKGGSGKDGLFGEGGKDKLLGQAGKDLLSGGGGNDTCFGGPGKDKEKGC